MAEPLDFSIQLTSNFASLLAPTNKGLEKHNELVGNATKHIGSFENALTESSKELRVFGSEMEHAGERGHGFFVFDLAGGIDLAVRSFETLVEWGHKAVDLIMDIGHAAAEAQGINLAIKLNAPEAEKELRELGESFDDVISPEKIERSWLPFLNMGIKNKDLLNALSTGANDLSVALQGDSREYEELMSSFQRLLLKGEASDKILRPLNIESKDFWKTMGAIRGVTAETAQELAKLGKFGKEELAAGVLDIIAKREGGALGTNTNREAETLGVTFDRLSRVKDELFKGIANSPGLKAMQGALDNFIATLKGPIGTDLVAKVGSAFEDIFGDLTGPDGLEKIRSGVGHVADKIKEMMDDFKAAWPDIKKGAGEVWDVMKGIADTIGMAVKGVREIVDFYHQLSSGRVWKDIKDTATGDVGGIAGSGINDTSPAWKRDKAARGELPASQTDIVRQKLGEELGGFVTSAPMKDANASEVLNGDWSSLDGIPHFAGGGIVNGPTLAIVGEHGPEAIIPLGTGGSEASPAAMNSPTFQVSIGPIYASGDGHAIAAEIAQGFRVEMTKFWRELGAQFGVAA